MTWFCLVFVMATQAYGGGGLVVGNGGEGWRLEDGRIYIRDLVESGTHLNPHIGSEASVVSSGEIKDSTLDSLSVPVELVRKKLADARKFYPGLDLILFRALTVYSWHLVEQELMPLPDDAPIIEIAPENRIQIANRFQGRILIHKENWNKLDPVQKTALLIHEAVYSLVAPVCKNGICKQPAYLARELVGLLFTHPSIAVTPTTRARVSEVLGLSALSSVPVERPDFGMSLALKNDDSDVLEMKALGVTGYLNELLAREFCIESELLATPRSSVRLGLAREPFMLSAQSYLSQNGATPQLWLKPRARVGQRDAGFVWRSAQSCEERLLEELEGWF